MASKLDEFDMKAPVADLLYPSVEKHNAMKKRAAALEKLPRAFVDNLELCLLYTSPSPRDTR